jgi:hypothetical protein
MSKITSKVGLLDSLEASINPATEESLEKLIGFEIPAYDYIALTYVAAGNGAGEIETVVYKSGGSGGSTVATLTLAYAASNEISSITKT